MMDDHEISSVYVVSSRFDSHLRYPYLAIFDNFEDALNLKDKIFDKMDPFYRENFYGWVSIEEQKLNASHYSARLVVEGL